MSINVKNNDRTIAEACIKALEILKKPSKVKDIKNTIIEHRLYDFGADEKNIHSIVAGQMSRQCINVSRNDKSKYNHFIRISSGVYDLIEKIESFSSPKLKSKDIDNLDDLESIVEGKKVKRYTTTYERDPKLRDKAIELYGTTCKVCNFNFEKVYGTHGKDYIQIHHIKPLSETEETKVNPETDLIPLCANCHVMIHKKKKRTLSIDELRRKIGK